IAHQDTKAMFPNMMTPAPAISAGVILSGQNILGNSLDRARAGEGFDWGSAFLGIPNIPVSSNMVFPFTYLTL
ncbi:hypothetical protein, partial [Runella sp.]|uniref:hypothetical protein n=1 Tax=Runella sp. TaxID=1960881 RepID=UPI00301A922B